MSHDPLHVFPPVGNGTWIVFFCVYQGMWFGLPTYWGSFKNILGTSSDAQLQNMTPGLCGLFPIGSCFELWMEQWMDLVNGLGHHFVKYESWNAIDRRFFHVLWYIMLSVKHSDTVFIAMPELQVVCQKLTMQARLVLCRTRIGHKPFVLFRQCRSWWPDVIFTLT